MKSNHLSLSLLILASLVSTKPLQKRATCTTGTINSLSDVSSAQGCSIVNINGFTVPAGETFNLDLADGATVNLNGHVLFGNKSWAGPLFEVSGKDITFNGNGNIFDGGGPFYWDGQGTNGGVQKPHPMMKIKISGTLKNVKVVNSPAQTFSISNPAALIISSVNIDNSQGDQPNSQSDGKPAGHNTDGFDASTTDLTIEDCTIKNQDDFLAINKGSNIVFTGNTLSGGHGISIGSIASDVSVSGITISNNKITNAQQALRIKMDASSTGSTVSNVTYSGNTGSGLTSFAVLIDQSYPSTLGTPGTGVILSDVNFVGSENTFSVESGAEQVAINCGSTSSCVGPWDFASLSVTGGTAGLMHNAPTLTGFSG